MKIKRIKIYPICYFDTPVVKSSIYTPIFARNNRFKNAAKFLSTKSNLLSNEKYNEMTAVYDIWKTYSKDLDFVGICHYRRILSLSGKKPLSHKEIFNLIENYNLILPKKRYYWPFNLKNHYIYSLKNYFNVHKNDIKVLKNIIIEQFPDYFKSFQTVMKRHSYHGGHIFLMQKDLFDSYCNFTFKICFELEKKLANRIDQTRFISALTEFTLDIWIDKHKLKYKEVYVYETEKLFLIKKILFVLKRIFK